MATNQGTCKNSEEKFKASSCHYHNNATHICWQEWRM